MKIVVTGAAGFLGRRLVEALAQRGELTGNDGRARPITSIVGADNVAATKPFADPRIEFRQGDIGDRSFVERLVGSDTSSVFHLAAVVSGAAEADFDLGFRVNVDAMRGLLESCRRLPAPPKFVFASSVAVFGGALPPVVTDATTPTPQTSYGIQKLIGELLVADFSRKGMIDGRSVRLPTIVVRPGAPNAAASSFASGIIREPIAGKESICPVPADTGIWMSSPGVVVANFIHAHETPADMWAARPGLNLPGVTASVQQMVDALRTVSGDATAGRVRIELDPRINRIVQGWPVRFETPRADSLGFSRDPDALTIVRAYATEAKGTTA
jgi:nucleoside-diphosphate-sugar epimerase